MWQLCSVVLNLAFKTECLCARLITKMHCLMCYFSKLEHIAHYKANNRTQSEQTSVRMHTQIQAHTYTHTHTYILSLIHI